MDILFARANILHKEKEYKKSAKYLISANDIKLKIKPSNTKSIIEKSKRLLIDFFEKLRLSETKEKSLITIGSLSLSF